jgi:uncharacterized membrane protein
MDFGPVQVGMFILAFVPGYIFIQTLDHHLLRGEKSQFEKTVQVLLASTVIWLFALTWPWLVPVEGEKKVLIGIVKNTIVSKKPKEDIIVELTMNSGKLALLYVFVCLYAFITSNLWGVLRRTKTVDYWIRKITKRDWYKTVALRFYDENVGSRVIITNKDKQRYVGRMNAAPDDKEDKCVILNDPYSIEKVDNKDSFTKLAAKSILINLDQVNLIEVISEPKRRQHGERRGKATNSSCP